MSTSTVRATRSATARPLTRPTPRTAPPPAAPRLRVVGAPEQLRRRSVAVGLAVALLVIGMIGLLLVTVSLSNGAYELRRLNNQQARLSDQRNALAEDIDTLASPRNLRVQAERLGMVDAPRTVVIKRSDGVAQGIAEAAPLPQQPASAAPSGKPSTAQVKAPASQPKATPKASGAKAQASKAVRTKGAAPKPSAATP